MLAAMRKMQSRYENIIAEVRGKGLLIGMQFKSAALGWEVVSRFFPKAPCVRSFAFRHQAWELRECSTNNEFPRCLVQSFSGGSGWD
jgi:acetylornithine/succinyldiaminopimelate/putrescine aminotransferase